MFSLPTPMLEGLKIPRANAHPGSIPGSGTICFQWVTVMLFLSRQCEKVKLGLNWVITVVN